MSHGSSSSLLPERTFCFLDISTLLQVGAAMNAHYFYLLLCSHPLYQYIWHKFVTMYFIQFHAYSSNNIYLFITGAMPV